MDFNAFVKLLEADDLPNGLSEELIVLWHDGKGLWGKAHDIAQDMEGRNGAILHAYLHRREGDNWNAQYWYTKAGEDMPKVSLKEEWDALVVRFLQVA